MEGHHTHHGHGHHHHHKHADVDAHAPTAPLATGSSAETVKALRVENTNPTFKDVSDILNRLGSCMTKYGSHLDFSQESVVRGAWDMIMDAAIPFDGRRQLVREDAQTGAYWLLRNQAASMPMDPKMDNLPDYGQFTDAELRTLNNWGESAGLTSYRNAISTCGPVGPAGPVAAGTRGGKLVRYDIDFVYNNPLFRSQILDAFRVLQDPTKFPRFNKDSKYNMFDLGEWGDLTAIHGGPWQVYRNQDGGLAMWCWHQVFQFLPWHRPWLASVEGALAAAQTSCGYVNPIGLPYWDQTKPYRGADGKDSYKNGHPMFFMKTYTSMADGKTYDNPLCAKNAKSLFTMGDPDTPQDGQPITNNGHRRVIRGWPQESLQTSENDPMKVKAQFPGKSWDEIIAGWDDDKNYFDFSEVKWPKGSQDSLVTFMKKHLCLAQMQPIFYAKPKVTATNPNPNEKGEVSRLGWAQWIETVHNQIHNWIGLDCQDATKAGFDPILYFFHSNIDRQLQAVIEHYGDEFFGWLSQTPDGTPDHHNDLTLLHMPVPFPKELHTLLRRRLGKFELPTYKNCFQLDWFSYKYYDPYVFPTPQEAGLDLAKTAWVGVKVNTQPMSKSEVVAETADQKPVGKAQTLGMSMNAGPMRMIHTPVFLDPVLFEYDESGPHPSTFTISVKQQHRLLQSMTSGTTLFWGHMKSNNK